jgi:hypothetical protein
MSCTVEVAGGTSATVEFRTSTREEDNLFEVDGRVTLTTTRSRGGAGGGSGQRFASADALWTMSVAVQRPSRIEINNCSLFDRDVLAMQADVTVAGDTCQFEVDGPRTSEMPGLLGMPPTSTDYDEIFEVYDMDEEDMPADVKAALEALYSDPEFSEELLDQSRDLGKALTGNVLFFQVNVEAESSDYGSELPETVWESFRVSITALPPIDD